MPCNSKPIPDLVLLIDSFSATAPASMQVVV
jgi:hypothetical protein